MQKNLIQQLWIDESGDSGFKFGKGSSHFLVLVAVYLIEVEEPDIAEKIARLRSGLRLTPEYEFKFSRCKDAVREAFLTAMTQLPILYKAIVVDKRNITAPALKTQPRQLYAESVKRLLHDNEPPLAKATLIIDEATAKELSQWKGQYLSFNGLEQIDEAVAKELGQFRNGISATEKIKKKIQKYKLEFLRRKRR